MFCGLLAITTSHPAAMPSGGAAPKTSNFVAQTLSSINRQQRGFVADEPYFAAQTFFPISSDLHGFDVAEPSFVAQYESPKPIKRLWKSWACCHH